MPTEQDKGRSVILQPFEKALAKRGKRQANEESEAMRNYHRAQEVARERLAALRSERLDREGNDEI